MNKGDRSVRYFSQLKNNYGKVRAELGFFLSLLFIIAELTYSLTCQMIISSIPSKHDLYFTSIWLKKFFELSMHVYTPCFTLDLQNL